MMTIVGDRDNYTERLKVKVKHRHKEHLFNNDDHSNRQ